VAAVPVISLAGPIAQFGRGGITREIATRITAEFIRNFEARLSAATSALDQPAGSAAAAPAPQALDAGNLVWSVIAARIRAFFQKIFGS